MKSRAKNKGKKELMYAISNKVGINSRIQLKIDTAPRSRSKSGLGLKKVRSFEQLQPSVKGTLQGFFYKTSGSFGKKQPKSRSRSKSRDKSRTNKGPKKRTEEPKREEGKSRMNSLNEIQGWANHTQNCQFYPQPPQGKIWPEKIQPKRFHLAQSPQPKKSQTVEGFNTMSNNFYQLDETAKNNAAYKNLRAEVKKFETNDKKNIKEAGEKQTKVVGFKQAQLVQLPEAMGRNRARSQMIVPKRVERPPDSQQRRRKFQLGLKKSMKMAQLSKKIKQLQEQNRVKERAVVTIQKNWRAYWVRKKLREEYQTLLRDKQREYPEVLLVKPDPGPPPPLPSLNFNSLLKEEVAQLKSQLEQFRREIQELRGGKKEQPGLEQLMSWPRPAENRLERMHLFQAQNKYDQIQLRLDERMRAMRGEAVLARTKGFDTSSRAVRELLQSLVKFIEGRPRALQRTMYNLNKAHGIEPKLRLVILHGYNEQADALVEEIENNMLVQVLDESLLSDFLDNLRMPDLDQADFEAYFSHLKAVVNAYNEVLSEYRPYYREESPPYPWTPCFLPPLLDQARSLRVLGEAVGKVEAQARMLGGVFLTESFPGEWEGIESAGLRQEALGKRRGERQQQLVRDYVGSVEERFYFWEDQRADVLMDMADELFDDLSKQMVSQVVRFSRLRALRL